MLRPKLFRLTIEDRKKSIDNLIESSSPNSDFFLMLILSTAIVVPGLLIDNASVIIGGMVVAPMLAPILTLALGITLSDFKLIRRSAVTILLSMLTVILIALLMGLFKHGASLGQEVFSRAEVSLAYLLISIASGAAAAFALSKPNLSAALPGVAVSVALLPPLAVTGIGLSSANLVLVTGSLALFFVNLIGMQFAALVVYSLMGLYPVRAQVGEKLQKEAAKKHAEERIHREEKKEEEKLERKEAALEKRIEEELEEKEKKIKKEAGVEEEEGKA